MKKSHSTVVNYPLVFLSIINYR